jgi:hypothetical protein
MRKPLDFDLLFGIDDNLPDRTRSQARTHNLHTAMQFANELFRRGRIDQATCMDAQCAIAGHLLDEAIADGEQYAQMRKDGSFDKLREIAGGRELPNESQEGTSARLDQALRGVLTQLTHEAYKAGGIPDRKFYDYMSNIDPQMERSIRKEMGFDQVASGSLDGVPRALSDREVHAMIHGDELGSILDGKPDKRKAAVAEANAPAERASDWSESKLESYFEKRDKDATAAREEFLHGGNAES